MNAIKTLLMALVMLCGTSTFADSYCADGKGGSRRVYGSEPCPPVNFTGEVLRFRSSDRYDDGQYRRQPVVRRTSQPQLPPGYTKRPCTPAESITRELVLKAKAFFYGALAGVAIFDSSRGAGVVGGVTMMFTDTGPCWVIIPPEGESHNTASDKAGRPIPSEEQYGGTEGGHDEVETVAQNRPVQRREPSRSQSIVTLEDGEKVPNWCNPKTERPAVRRSTGERFCESLK